MTRWLVVLSVVTLSAGALEARADAIPTEFGDDKCGGYPGPICATTSISKCTEWRGEKFEITAAGKSVSAGYTITCASWNTVTSTTYYPA
jgi:hypothetical protein